MLEGGGQIVRVAAALAAATGRETTVRSIRAGRPKPGLAAQHLAGLDACRRACGGSFVGGDPAVGSTSVTLRPGSAAAAARSAAARPDPDPDPDRPDGEASWRADVGTAGAVSLVAQAAVPALILGGRPARLRITGGTDVAMAPRSAISRTSSPRSSARTSASASPSRRSAADTFPGAAARSSRASTRPRAKTTEKRFPSHRFASSVPARAAAATPSPPSSRVGSSSPRAGRVDHPRRAAVAVAAMREALSRSPTLAVAAEAMAAAGVPVVVARRRRRATATAVPSCSSRRRPTVASRWRRRRRWTRLEVALSRNPREGTRSWRSGHEPARNSRRWWRVARRWTTGCWISWWCSWRWPGRDRDRVSGRRLEIEGVARWPISEHARAAMATCEAVTGAKFDVHVGDEGGVEEGLCAVECVGAPPRRERDEATRATRTTKIARNSRRSSDSPRTPS